MNAGHEKLLVGSFGHGFTPRRSSCWTPTSCTLTGGVSSTHHKLEGYCLGRCDQLLIRPESTSGVLDLLSNEQEAWNSRHENLAWWVESVRPVLGSKPARNSEDPCLWQKPPGASWLTYQV